MKRCWLSALAFVLSAVGVVLFGSLVACDLLEPPSLSSYSSEELIDELLDRGAENLGDLFEDLDGLFGDDD